MDIKSDTGLTTTDYFSVRPVATRFLPRSFEPEVNAFHTARRKPVADCSTRVCPSRRNVLEYNEVAHRYPDRIVLAELRGPVCCNEPTGCPSGMPFRDETIDYPGRCFALLRRRVVAKPPRQVIEVCPDDVSVAAIESVFLPEKQSPIA